MSVPEFDAGFDGILVPPSYAERGLLLLVVVRYHIHAKKMCNHIFLFRRADPRRGAFLWTR